MNRRRLDQRLLASGGVLLAVLFGAATLFAAGLVNRGSANSGIRVVASGAISVSNSKDGAAIFDLVGVGPGTGGEGEVTIGNTGSAPGTLTLASLDRADARGLYGGALSGRLDLRIADVTAGNDAEVYAGGLASMPELGLGTLAGGESRTYRLTISMRDGGSPSTPYADDNLYQRATTSLAYQWTLTESEPGVPPPVAPDVPAAPAPPASDGFTPPGGSPPGIDPLVGDAHPNLIVGTSQHDLIYGLGAADAIFARAGDDYALGGAGADRVYGGPGDDRLRGGTGSDRVYGGSGSDVLFARDGEVDLVDCGSGSDIAYVDQHDLTKSCEAVHRQYGRLFSSSRPGG
jgi:Ca2+-binding RTX toxin-like protein